MMKWRSARLNACLCSFCAAMFKRARACVRARAVSALRNVIRTRASRAPIHGARMVYASAPDCAVSKRRSMRSKALLRSSFLKCRATVQSNARCVISALGNTTRLRALCARQASARAWRIRARGVA
eukprot:2398500-Lingulodinium_polyedra.AAC.1